MNYSKDVLKAYEIAIKARGGAYAPYSNFKVGSAVKFSGSNQIFSGCNVENSSYSLTVCGERNAIHTAISEESHRHIEFLVLVTDNTPAVPPCGSCLQVISEFADENSVIYLSNLEGIQSAIPFKQFLPYSFSKESLL